MPRMPKAPQRPRKNVTFEDVLARLDANERPYDRDFLTAVYEFTGLMHRDQVRRSGQPYITHPIYVAYILADLKFDQTCVATALLHDVLEDTLTTKAVLEAKFGHEVAHLVDGVTKIGRQEYVHRDEAQAETFRKMILASARDLRVILVKLADRLHNMMTLEHKSPESRRRIASETLDIYSPIALRLGMSKLQGDLEDLAFYFRYPRLLALHLDRPAPLRAGTAFLRPGTGAAATVLLRRTASGRRCKSGHDSISPRHRPCRLFGSRSTGRAAADARHEGLARAWRLPFPS